MNWRPSTLDSWLAGVCVHSADTTHPSGKPSAGEVPAGASAGPARDTHRPRHACGYGTDRRTRGERRVSSRKRPSPASNLAPQGHAGSSPKNSRSQVSNHGPRRRHPAASAASMPPGTQSSHPETEKIASTSPGVNHNKLAFIERLLCQAPY